MKRTNRGMVLLVLAFAFPLAARAADRHSPDLATAKIVDLTHAFDERTIYWPTSASTFELKKLAYGDTPAGYFYSSYSFCAPEHGGTHLDVPIHSSRTGRTLDQVPVRQLIAPGIVIDVSTKTEADADYPSKSFLVHQIALGAQVPGLENVPNLEEVPETGAWIIALPMKIAGGSGGPARIVAMVPEGKP